MELTTDNPGTAVAWNCAVAVPMPNVVPNLRSWTHVSTSQVASRRIVRTRVRTDDNYTADNYTAESFAAADSYLTAGTFAVAPTKQGAPPRGEPR